MELYFFSIFQFPYITRKSCTVGIKFVFKRFDMVIVLLLFKLSLSQSKIYFFQVTGCCCTFIYDTFLCAITIEEVICLNSAIKSLLCLFSTIFLLCPLIICDLFWVQLWLTLKVFSLKIFCIICFSEGNDFLSNSEIFLPR